MSIVGRLTTPRLLSTFPCSLYDYLKVAESNLRLVSSSIQKPFAIFHVVWTTSAKFGLLAGNMNFSTQTEQ